MENLYIIGSGGHSRVVLDSINFEKYKVHIIDFLNIKTKENVNLLKKYFAISSFNEINKIKLIKDKNIFFHVAIGNNSLRKKYFDKFKSLWTPLSIFDNTSKISKNLKIGRGCYVAKNTVINSNVIIKDNCIINSSAIIEHDCTISSHSHICPGVILAGSVFVGRNNFIGIGARVLPNINISENCEVGAGSILNKNLKKTQKQCPLV